MIGAMDISRITKIILTNSKKKYLKNDPFNRKKCNVLQSFKSLQFSMVQSYLNPNITFLGEKLTHRQSQTRKWIQRTPFRFQDIFLLPIIKDRSKNVCEDLAEKYMMCVLWDTFVRNCRRNIKGSDCWWFSSRGTNHDFYRQFFLAILHEMYSCFKYLLFSNVKD